MAKAVTEKAECRSVFAMDALVIGGRSVRCWWQVPACRWRDRRVVAFGGGRAWADRVANAAKRYRNMGVTYSSAGEYGNAIDILPPA
jgi:hypothetical protein